MNEARTAKARVVIYTRQGCHLCDAVKEQITRAGCDALFSLEESDIDSDPELARRYGYDIPVVTIDGAHAFKHQLNAEDFRRELRRALATRTP